VRPSRASISVCAFLLLFSLLAAACEPIGPVTVTLIADGETRTLTTDAQTVRDLLIQADVLLDADDRVVPPENNFVRNEMTIQIVRVEVEIETQEQIIPYGRETVRDATVPAGEIRLLQAGVNGLEEISYSVTFEDGVELERRIARTVIIQEPQNEIVLIGAREEVAAVPISGTIAYVSARNGWVMRANTSDIRRLTSSGDLDGRIFELSPDGAWLLFTRATTETGLLNTLWMIDTVTANAEPVRLSVDDVLWAGWAPNSGEICYSTGTFRDTAPGWEAANDLYIAEPRDRDGMLVGRRRVLAASAGGTYGWWGTVFTWDPDGQSLAYSQADEVGVVDLFTGQKTSLIKFPPYRTRSSWAWTPSVTWSPEGDLLVTSLHGPSSGGELPEDSPVFDIFALGVTEPLTVELVAEIGMWAAPSFSPDGDMIVYGQARAPNTSQTSSYDLYLMDRDGSDQRLLFPTDRGEPGLEYPAVVWDPWGNRFIAVYQGNLYLVPTEGQARRVTDDGAATTVRWTGLPSETGE
jgi:Tol biopolymer transport system component